MRIICIFFVLIASYCYGRYASNWSINTDPSIIEECLRKSIKHITFGQNSQASLLEASNIVCKTQIHNGLNIILTFNLRQDKWECYLYKSLVDILSIRFEKCQQQENNNLMEQVQKLSHTNDEHLINEDEKLEANIDAIHQNIQQQANNNQQYDDTDDADENPDDQPAPPVQETANQNINNNGDLNQPQQNIIQTNNDNTIGRRTHIGLDDEEEDDEYRDNDNQLNARLDDEDIDDEDIDDEDIDDNQPNTGFDDKGEEENDENIYDNQPNPGLADEEEDDENTNDNQKNDNVDDVENLYNYEDNQNINNNGANGTVNDGQYLGEDSDVDALNFGKDIDADGELEVEHANNRFVLDETNNNNNNNNEDDTDW